MFERIPELAKIGEELMVKLGELLKRLDKLVLFSIPIDNRKKYLNAIEKLSETVYIRKYGKVVFEVVFSVNKEYDSIVFYLTPYFYVEEKPSSKSTVFIVNPDQVLELLENFVFKMVEKLGSPKIVNFLKQYILSISTVTTEMVGRRVYKYSIYGSDAEVIKKILFLVVLTTDESKEIEEKIRQILEKWKSVNNFIEQVLAVIDALSAVQKL